VLRRYINHSNKALRPLNMHLNLRRARLPILSYLHLRPFTTPLTKPTGLIPNPAPVSISSARPPVVADPTRRASLQPTVMAQIPASTNPRGELIFSSRVDKSFREGYERYRAAFERRREEKARQDAARLHGGLMGWARELGTVNRGMTPTPIPTPPASRRGTPPPGMGANRGRSPSPGSRLRFGVEDEKGEGGGGGGGGGGRDKVESYSFAWTAAGDTAPLRKAS